MKNLFSGLLVLAGSFFMFGQEARNVGDFTSLKVYDRIPVELVKSNKAKVEVYEGNDGDVEVINKNGELKVRMAVLKKMQGTDARVKIYFKDLRDIQASQGSIITSQDPIDGSILKLTSNEGAKILVEVDVNRLDVKANSGGELKLTGKAKNQDIIINSGAKYNGEHLKGQIATVASNAGGVADVYASESVRATVRAGGTINVYGDPEDRDTKKVAGGNISFK